MDKILLDELIKFGLVTNINVDPDKYKDVDDLINKGVITIPGAKSKILEIMDRLNMTETTEVVDEVVKVKEDEIVEVTEIDETKAPTEEIVDAVEVVEETPVEEVVTEEAPVEEVVETPEETSVEETPKKKKSTKKTE